MRIVWSFWTKPFYWRYRSRWFSEKHHFLSWILSVELARKHYQDTTLYTDDQGAEILVEGLGLKFDKVSLELNTLRDHDPQWWALGKAYTYRLQTAPFIHLDNDVFLWKRLISEVEAAPVITQNPEYFAEGIFHYRPEVVDYAIKGIHDGWLPREWEWYRAFGRRQRGECCGIFGGNAIDFIVHYADQAIKMIEHPLNQDGWAVLDTDINRNVQVEQYLLSACVEYHRSRSQSPFHNIRMGYLFKSNSEAHNSQRAEQVGYTHLMGNLKQNPELNQRLEARVKRDYPDFYERCLSWLGASSQSYQRRVAQ